MPLWALVLLIGFAGVTFASHFLFPSVRWFFRKRMERLVGQLNTRLKRPIEPFKLARRYDMIQRLVYDPEVSKAIAAYAHAEGIPENVAFQRARRYAREIVPAFSAWTYFRFGSRVAEWLGRSFYKVRVLNRDLSKIDGLDKNATVVLVANHRSNMDYVLLTYLAARNGALSYAVGEWARRWPLGPLVRAMGAYFIRRRDGNELYRQVLANYVKQATKAGVAQAVFPEGGLSLDGKLASPKLGILKYIIEAHDAEGRDLYFVPVAINYDRLLEGQVLLRAQALGERRFRISLRRVALNCVKLFWQGRRERRRRFGAAIVQFGDPIPLQKSPVDLTQLAETLMEAIAAKMPVPIVPLLCRALLESPSAVDQHALETRLRDYQAQLPPGNLHVPGQNFSLALSGGLAILRDQKLLDVVGETYGIAAGKEPVLQFYADSVAHLFCARSVENTGNSATAGS